MSAAYPCPHCGEEVDTYPDPGGGPHQEYIEDCPVCCRPNRIIASLLEESDGYEVRAFSDA